VGETYQHLTTRFKEHISRKKRAVYKHLASCEIDGIESDMSIICATHKGETHLLILEALWIKEVKPEINVKDEYKSRVFIIKFL